MRTCICVFLASGSLWGAIHGTVQDGSGAAVPRARVFLLKPPLAARSAWSDISGAFRFDDPGAGRCVVFAVSPDLAGDKVETPCDASAPLTLVLRPAALAETVIVTAQRAELPASAVTSSVSVLTAEDLNAQQAIHLLEALRYLPGVEVNQTGRRGGVTGLFVRGAESRYNLVTLDGVKVNDFGGPYNFTGLTGEQIGRLEVARGPQSAQYGSYAIGSAVQLVTPSGLDGQDLFASAEGGSFATRRFTAGGGSRLGPLGLHGAASRFDSDGIVANDDSRFENLRLKADYLLRPRHRLQYSLTANANDSGNPGAFGSDPLGRFRGLDLATRTRERYNVHGFLYDAELGERVRQRLRGALYSDRLDFQSRFGPSFTRQSRNWFSSETSVALGGRDLLIAGFEWHGERFRNAFVSPLQRGLYGWFAEHHLERGRFFLNAGLRVEHVRLDGRPGFPASVLTQAHPRLSAAYILLPSTRLHAAGATGLRPPDGFELAFTTNPALKPERTRSLEAGLEHSFLDRRLAVDATWFYNRFHDQIVTLTREQSSLSRWQSDNLANAETQGLEVSVQAQPRRGLRLRGAYTYLDTAVLSLDGSSLQVQRFFRLGQQLLRRPRHAGSWLAVWQNRRWIASTGAVLRGRTLDAEPNLGLSGGQFLNPFYPAFHLAAQYQLGGGLWLTARLHNLFNRRYEESLGFPALGRNFTVGLKWKWIP